MRNYGRFLKNIAALCMLVALLALLLPFCQVTDKSSGKADVTTVSGFDMVVAGGKLTAQYVKDRQIPEDYVVKGELTWGDIKQAIVTANDAAGTEILVGMGVALAFPVVCCLFALLATLIASKKKGMVLPIFFLGAAILENVFLIMRFGSLVDAAKKYTAKGVTIPTITLLVGIYAFTLLCALALIIIIFAWLIRGFEDPEKNNRRNGRGSDSRDSKDHHRRKRRKKKKSKRGKKKDRSKGDKDKKQKENEEQRDKDAENEEDKIIPAQGRVAGVSGIYSDVVSDLAKNGSCMIGTTPEAMAAVKSNHISSLESLANKSCMIKYDAASKYYTVTSHSATSIIVQSDVKTTVLQNGQSVRAGKDTILRVGNDSKSSLYLH